MQEAAAGGGSSYAALYDRYSEQVYNYCLRLTGTPDDAADATQDAFVNVLGRLHRDDRPVLNFSSYLFAAARNESYALMRSRTRTRPTEVAPEPALPEPDVETDPERAVLLRDSQEAVRQANSRLAPRHREVLALREVAGRSYEEIGDIMGISENAAAQLIWRARSKLKEALTAGAVASVVAASEDCEAAQVLINRLHDGEPITDHEHIWLDDHLEECPKCRAARGMVLEMATSYRAWAPVAVLATMKADVLTASGHVVGADWSGVHMGGGHAAGSHGIGRLVHRRPRGVQAAAGTAVTAAAMATAAIVVLGLGNDESVIKDVVPPAANKAAAPKKEKAAPAAHPAKAASKPARIHPTPRVIPTPPVVQATPAPKHHVTPPVAHTPNATPPGPRAQPPNPPKPPVNHPKRPPGPPANPPVTHPPVSPPVEQPPVTPPTGGGCTWHGNGIGPGGCPPGHGGVPPGHGGTPPGQAKKRG